MAFKKWLFNTDEPSPRLLYMGACLNDLGRQEEAQALFREHRSYENPETSAQSAEYALDKVEFSEMGVPSLLSEKMSEQEQRTVLEEALQDCDSAIKGDPEESRYFFLRARILMSLERDREALEAIDTGLQMDPEVPDAEVWKNRGRIFLNLDRPADAAAAFGLARRKDPKDPYVALWLYWAYEKLGRKDEAKGWHDIFLKQLREKGESES